MPNNLKFWRERRGFNQADLARYVGVSRQALSAIESQKQDPSLALALKLSQMLDLPVQQIFLSEESEMKTNTVLLTKPERLALINQYRILQQQYKDDEYTAKHYARLEEIVQRGYTFLYDEIFDSIWPEMPEEDSNEVLTILSMHRALHDAAATLPDPKEQEKVKFQGFDANNESEYLSFARFFTADGDRFRELNIFNSHCPMLPRYRKMVAEWSRLGKSFHLTKAEMDSIVEAGIFKH